MMYFASLLLLAGICQATVVLDRIAVIVGKHVIKTSDIERDLRLTDFLNRARLDLGPAARRQAAERLIDQEIIRQEIVTGQYKRPADSEAESLETNFRQDRFGGSELHLREALRRYDLNEQQLQSQFLWQLTVLRFIDERFRPGVLVTDEEIRAYYDQHLRELQREYPPNPTFEALKDKIRETIEGERINQEFDRWVQEARKRYRIEYRQEAFT
jgi:peptidyl-prolyl cis-trans isomerase SurA